MPLGFGIIGCGSISDFHARAIRDVRGAKLVACYSRTAESAERLAAAHGIRAYYELDALLDDKRIDVVTIATPSGNHMEPATEAARAGKHVLVEKPLEITLARCDTLVAECERANVLLGTIFPSRFHEAARRMKQAVEAGRFGALTVGNAIVKWYRTQAYYDSGKWRGTWELDGGGALMNQAIHSVDLLLWLMGPVVEVSAHTALLAHERIAVEDTVVASLRFANNALGSIVASTAVYPGYLKRVEIHGSEGSATLEEENILSWDFAKLQRGDASLRKAMAGKTKTGGGAADPKAIGHHGHARQFQDFVNALRRGEKPFVDGREGRRAVELILAIYKSAETGRTVTLPLAKDPVLAARKFRAK